MILERFEERIQDGDCITADEALWLYTETPTHWLGRMANLVRERKHPARIVTYIIDQNVNYTNVCVAR